MRILTNKQATAVRDALKAVQPVGADVELRFGPAAAPVAVYKTGFCGVLVFRAGGDRELYDDVGAFEAAYGFRRPA